MSALPSPARSPLPRWWAWLFPLTFCVHASEEYFVSDPFYAWLSRLWAIDLSREEFLVLNAVGVIAMAIAAVVVSTTPARWPLATLGFLTAANGTLHTVASIVTGAYSPGTVSGLLIWLPLGTYTLMKSYRELTPFQFRTAIIVGIGAQALLSLAAFSLG